jgi:hypothetical protein
MRRVEMSTWLVSAYPPKPRKPVAPEVWAIVDVNIDDENTKWGAVDAAFEQIAGGEYTMSKMQPLLTGAIPFACRNVLFTSEKELYARVPDLDQAFAPDDDERSAP